MKITIRDTSTSGVNYKSELNEEQYNAVIHTEGPAIVIAGAGSGKTRMLTYRVAYLIDHGFPASSIVLVTFTKKAAKEMIDRVEGLVGKKSQGIFAGTFHHLSNLILRKYSNVIGFKPNFTVLDRSDQIDLMRSILQSETEKAPETRYPTAAQMIDIYSEAINLGLSHRDVIKKSFQAYVPLTKEIDKLLQYFKNRKKRSNVMDFDDLMVYFLQFLRAEESVGFREKLQHTLVDEFQDVNFIQSEIVHAISTNVKSLVVVGDDAQAIYSWRGSDFKHMLFFPKIYPGTREFKLEMNYRSTPEILNLANKSIANNKNQFQKTLRTIKASGELPLVCPCTGVDQEAKLITQLILDNRESGIPLNEQVVLFRAKYHSVQIEMELIRQNIPYEVRAGRFFEQAHIKDLISYLTIIANSDDETRWIRVLSMHNGISDVAAQKIITALDTPRLNDTNRTRLERFVQINLAGTLKGQRIRSIGFDNLAHLQRFFKKNFLSPNGITLPIDQLGRLGEIVNKIVGYLLPILKERYPDQWEDRLDDLRELTTFANTYNNLETFLGDILTQFDVHGETDTESENDEKPLVLSTIHQAKGLEWQVVYLISLADGRFPSKRSIGSVAEIEEERRLFYVATTRAKDKLYLTYPFLSNSFDVDVIETSSLFLDEISDQEVFETAEVE